MWHTVAIRTLRRILATPAVGPACSASAPRREPPCEPASRRCVAFDDGPGVAVANSARVRARCASVVVASRQTWHPAARKERRSWSPATARSGRSKLPRCIRWGRSARRCSRPARRGRSAGSRPRRAAGTRRIAARSSSTSTTCAVSRRARPCWSRSARSSTSTASRRWSPARRPASIPRTPRCRCAGSASGCAARAPSSWSSWSRRAAGPAPIRRRGSARSAPSAHRTWWRSRRRSTTRTRWSTRCCPRCAATRSIRGPAP